MTRADVHQRFRELVARAIERADHEDREHLARLRPAPAERAAKRKPRPWDDLPVDDEDSLA